MPAVCRREVREEVRKCIRIRRRRYLVGYADALCTRSKRRRIPFLDCGRGEGRFIETFNKKMRKEQLLEHFDTYFLCATADELADQYEFESSLDYGFRSDPKELL
jgi:hypothetical protein